MFEEWEDFGIHVGRSALALAGQAAVCITCEPIRPMCCVSGSTPQ
jgi:hypothetical protein